MLAFFPAFPAFNRITRNGIHYIDGTPVAESVFGKDPFTPVTDSSVKEIIGSQTSLPLFLNELNDKPGIHIYDGESDEDLKRLGLALGKERLHLSAGCAAFAPILAEIIGFERRRVPPAVLKKGLIVYALCRAEDSPRKR